jgi:hypothetical protein
VNFWAPPGQEALGQQPAGVGPVGEDVGPIF